MSPKLLLLGPAILKEATLVPFAHPPPPPTGGGGEFGGTHSLRLVPVAGELSRGGTTRYGTARLSHRWGRREKGTNVCAGEGKASRFRSVSAKQAVTLR